MSTKLATLSLSTLFIASTAAAQPHEGVRSEVAPISNALEIALGGGFMRGAGDIGGGMPSVDDLSRNGGGAEVSLGYRITPNLAVGAYGTLSGYYVGAKVAPTTDLVIGGTLGAKADWHYRPGNRIDPWISVGAGWRGMWMGNDAATERKLQGIDITRVQIGADLRVTPSVALSPYIGASATVFVAQGDPMTGDYVSIANKELNFSFTGGLLARFDIAGSRGR